MTFEIAKLTEYLGGSYWVLFTHGQFHNPVALIPDIEARRLAETVLGLDLCKSSESLGEQIKTYRKKNKLTQGDFAKRCMVSRTYLSMIERGEAVNLSMMTNEKILFAMRNNVVS